MSAAKQELLIFVEPMSEYVSEADLSRYDLEPNGEPWFDNRGVLVVPLTMVKKT